MFLLKGKLRRIQDFSNVIIISNLLSENTRGDLFLVSLMDGIDFCSFIQCLLLGSLGVFR